MNLLSAVLNPVLAGLGGKLGLLHLQTPEAGTYSPPVVFGVDVPAVPSNVMLRVDPGVLLEVSSDFAIEGGLEAGLHQVFTGDLDQVRIFNTDPIRGEWFCGIPDGNTDNAEGMQAAIDSAPLPENVKVFEWGKTHFLKPWVFFGPHPVPWVVESRNLNLSHYSRVGGGGMILLKDNKSLCAIDASRWSLVDLTLVGDRGPIPVPTAEPPDVSSEEPWIPPDESAVPPDEDENWHPGLFVSDSGTYWVKRLYFADLDPAVFGTNHWIGWYEDCRIEPSCYRGFFFTNGDTERILIDPAQERPRVPDPPRFPEWPLLKEFKKKYGPSNAITVRDSVVCAIKAFVLGDTGRGAWESSHVRCIALRNNTIECQGGLTAVTASNADDLTIAENWFEGWTESMIRLRGRHIRCIRVVSNQFEGPSGDGLTNCLLDAGVEETQTFNVSFCSNHLNRQKLEYCVLNRTGSMLRLGDEFNSRPLRYIHALLPLDPSGNYHDFDWVPETIPDGLPPGFDRFVD